MFKQKATELFDRYMREHSDPRDLSFRQIDAVIDALLKTRFDHPADIDDVAAVVERVCPQEKNQMPQTQKPKQKQSIKEVAQIIEYFIANYWARLVPKAIVPTENGNKRNAINYLNFGTAVRERFNEGKRIGHDVLGEIALSLDAAGLLEHHPQVVERIVEVEKKVPLTRREEQKHSFNLNKLMNAPGVDAIKGIGEQVQRKPVVSEAELAAQATHDLRENEVMGDVRSVISGHTHSGSHSSTRYEREILQNVMTDGIRKNLSAETILTNVKAKQDVMSKWGPQQALKELRPELFTGPKAAGY